MVYSCISREEQKYSIDPIELSSTSLLMNINSNLTAFNLYSTEANETNINSSIQNCAASHQVKSSKSHDFDFFHYFFDFFSLFCFKIGFKLSQSVSKVYNINLLAFWNQKKTSFKISNKDQDANYLLRKKTNQLLLRKKINYLLHNSMPGYQVRTSPVTK